MAWDNIGGWHLRQRQRGQLGLQRIAAGGSAKPKLLWCGSSSKDGASDNFGFYHGDGKLRARVVQLDDVIRRVRFDCLMGILGT